MADALFHPEAAAEVDAAAESEPDSPESGNNRFATPIQPKRLTVTGYIREAQELLPFQESTMFNIPSSIGELVLKYYFGSDLDIILEDLSLRILSLELVISPGNKFVGFLKQMLDLDLKDKIWGFADQEGKGVIDEEMITKFWYGAAVLFVRATNHFPFCVIRLRKSVKHLATWIIWKYGELQPTGKYMFRLDQEGFRDKVIEYLQSYIDVKGALQ